MGVIIMKNGMIMDAWDLTLTGSQEQDIWAQQLIIAAIVRILR